MFRIDIGFNPDKGYAAVLFQIDPAGNHRQKGIKAGNIRQLMRRVAEETCAEEQRLRRFPLEKEEPKRIITNGF